MKNGIIHYRNINTFLFVVKLDDGTFTVFESFVINAFNTGDIVSGHIDKTGIYEIMNASTRKFTYVMIVNTGLNEAMAMDKANLR